MNLRRLKYFIKIVDVGSLTQAADILHIAQPALSQQLATLEGEVDQRHFCGFSRQYNIARGRREDNGRR